MDFVIYNYNRIRRKFFCIRTYFIPISLQELKKEFDAIKPPRDENDFGLALGTVKKRADENTFNPLRKAREVLFGKDYKTLTAAKQTVHDEQEVEFKAIADAEEAAQNETAAVLEYNEAHDKVLLQRQALISFKKELAEAEAVLAKEEAMAEENGGTSDRDSATGQPTVEQDTEPKATAALALGQNRVKDDNGARTTSDVDFGESRRPDHLHRGALAESPPTSDFDPSNHVTFENDSHVIGGPNEMPAEARRAAEALGHSMISDVPEKPLAKARATVAGLKEAVNEQKAKTLAAETVEHEADEKVKKFADELETQNKRAENAELQVLFPRTFCPHFFGTRRTSCCWSTHRTCFGHTRTSFTTLPA